MHFSSMRIGLFVFFLFISLHAQSQAPVEKWGAQQVHYAGPASVEAHETAVNASILNYTSKVYHVLISEADGDRCPFIPTCSGFFVESVHKTNFLQGLCMFADRFTRDANPVNREENYRFDVKHRRFADPVQKYILR